MRKKSHAFSDAIGQKPTLIIYTLALMQRCVYFFRFILDISTTTAIVYLFTIFLPPQIKHLLYQHFYFEKRNL